MRLFVLITLLSTIMMASAQAADHPPLIKLGAGIDDVFDDETSTAFKLDLRSNYQWLGLIDPFLAFSANNDGGIYGGVGLTGDLDLNEQWVVTPSVAAGFYGEGDSVDLGGAVQFRTGAELAYKLSNDSRVGMELTHTSNFGLYDDNPGTETLTVNYTLPLTLLSK